MLLLGFSCGLPFLLVGGTFTARLATADIDIKTIGLLTYLLLPYSFKFLWAPIVDAFDVRPVADPRPQAGLDGAGAGRHLRALVAMAVTDPLLTLPLLGLSAFLLAFSAATQDIVVDAWRIESAGIERQGPMLAAYQLGYRLGLVTAGAGRAGAGRECGLAGLLPGDGGPGWGSAIAASLLAPAPPERLGEREVRERFRFGRAVAAPVADLYRRQGPAPDRGAGAGRLLTACPTSSPA